MHFFKIHAVEKQETPANMLRFFDYLPFAVRLHWFNVKH